MRESTSRLPSAEQPDPLSLVLLMRVLRAASGDVRRFVDDHRSVAGADAVGGLAGSVRGLDHRGPAGGHGQVARGHQLVRQRNARALDRLQDVFRSTQPAQGLAHQPDDFVGGAAARRVRREDDGVLAFDRVDGDPDRRHVGAGDRNQRGDHTGRLRVLDDALLGNLLDDPHALLPQRVAQDSQRLAAAARLRTAQAALRDAHLRQPRRRDLVRRRPGDGLTETIHGALIVGFDGSHRHARALEHASLRAVSRRTVISLVRHRSRLGGTSSAGA